MNPSKQFFKVIKLRCITCISHWNLISFSKQISYHWLLYSTQKYDYLQTRNTHTRVKRAYMPKWNPIHVDQSKFQRHTTGWVDGEYRNPKRFSPIHLILIWVVLRRFINSIFKTKYCFIFSINNWYRKETNQ